MPNKYAVIIFIFSLAFAATTVFLLCLLQPKRNEPSSSRDKGGSKNGLDAYEALAGLPIKKRTIPQYIRWKNVDQPESHLITNHQIVEPFLDEWAEMGYSVRSIRRSDEIKKKKRENWQDFIEMRKLDVSQHNQKIVPMARVLYWQDQLEACKVYKSIFCQKAKSYWMMMNGLQVANIVKHGRRELENDDQTGRIEKDNLCDIFNVKNPNCTRQAIIVQNRKDSNRSEDLRMMNESKAGTGLESIDGTINLSKAQLQAQEAGLAPGFLIDTKYPNTF